MRNALKDPIPGDVFRKGDVTRTITESYVAVLTFREGDGIHYAMREGFGEREPIPAESSWEKWADGAEVVSMARDPRVHPQVGDVFTAHIMDGAILLGVRNTLVTGVREGRITAFRAERRVQGKHEYTQLPEVDLDVFAQSVAGSAPSRWVG